LAQASKILFSAPDTRPSLQQAARALHETGLLGAYFTTLALNEGGRTIRTAQALDGIFRTRLASELRRRAVREFPGDLIRRFPYWDVPRTLLSRMNVPERIVDRLHHASLRSLDRHVARNLNGFAGVYAVNLAAKAAFSAAKKRRIACIYEVIALEIRSYVQMLRQESEIHPSLFPRGTPQPADLEQHIRRCDAEWTLADLVIVNSNLTRDTYAAAGFDIGKARVIPLGFPPVVSEERFHPPRFSSPLHVLWAGNFSVNKGAHYLLAALKSPALRQQLRVTVFGKQLLPADAVAGFDDVIEFHGTVPHTQLFAEYRRADVLVLPTLSDGFAMVVSEAMSQGLPVITTEWAGVAQFIVPGENGLIVPARDPDALAEAIVSCAARPEQRREMGVAARQTALQWQWSDYRNAVASAVLECLRTQAMNSATR
jgi:glycosyltransferase involved in cell wall biosynthesis